MKIWLVLIFISITSLGASAGSRQTQSVSSRDTGPDTAGVKIIPNISYKSGHHLDAYEKERCKLDLYLPSAKIGFATLVWFHGGGLEIGNKTDVNAMARSLARAGVAVVCPEYRLSPRAKYPTYVQDAAAAFAWTQAHIHTYGGDPNALFIGGHSAGGWLALMVGLDAHYLAAVHSDLSNIAGIISVSGQTMTHFTVRKERGIGRSTITADEAAPIYYARKDTAPILMLYADHDMSARAEEDAYFVAVMKGAGNEHVTGQLISDRTHTSIAAHLVDKADPARLVLLEFIQSHSRFGQSTQQ